MKILKKTQLSMVKFNVVIYHNLFSMPLCQ